MEQLKGVVGESLECPSCGYKEPEYGFAFGCYTQHNTTWECPNCEKVYLVDKWMFNTTLKRGEGE